MVERCLLHLLLNFFTARASQRSRHEAPLAITQEGIAQALGMGRNNVPRLVHHLASQGWVEAQRERVQGFRAKKTVYYLTYRGLEEAKRIKVRLAGQVVRIVGVDGEVVEGRVEDIPSILGIPASLGEVVAHLEDGTFHCRRYLEAKGRELNKGGSTRLPQPRYFYGRGELLGRLSAALGGPGFRCVVVHGLAGVGKTSLVAAHYASWGPPVLYIRIRSWTTLRGLVHSIAAFGFSHGATDLFVHAGQHAATDLEAMLLACGRDLSKIGGHVVLDDFHNASPEILAFGKALLELPPEHHDFKLVIVSREAPTIYSRARAKLGGEVTTVEVEGLAREDSFRLMATLGLPAGQFERIHRITRGHPLIIELTAVGGLPPTGDLVPFVEEEVLASLRPEELQLLHRAAAHRRPVPSGGLAGAREHGLLGVLCGKSLLKDVGDGTYELHDLIREAILGSMTGPERRECHLWAAEYYSGLQDLPSRLELAHHLLELGDQGRAAGELVQREEEFLRAGYTRDLDLLIGRIAVVGLAPTTAAQLLLLRGSVAIIEGNWQRAQEALVEAEARAASAGDTLTVGRSLRTLGDLAIRRGDCPSAIELLQRAKAIAEECGDIAGLTAVHYQLGSAQERLGDLAKAREHFTSGLELAEELGNDREAGRILYAFARLDYRRGEHEGAVREQERALEYLKRSGDLVEMAKVQTHLGGDLYRLGRLEEGIGHQLEAIALSERTGDMRTLAYALHNLARGRWEAGDPAAGEVLLEKALAISDSLGERWSQAHIYMSLGEVVAAQDKAEKAKLFLRQAVLRMRRDVGPFDAAKGLMRAGKVYAELGMLEEAGDCHSEALRMSQEGGHGDLMARAQDLLKTLGARVPRIAEYSPSR